MLNKQSQQKVYDHRLRQLVFESGDINIAVRLGVPRSTATDWLRRQPKPVVTLDLLDMDTAQLQQEVLRLRSQVSTLNSLYRLLLALVTISGARLKGKHITDERSKLKLLRAIKHAYSTFPLRSVLRVIGLSESRYFSWVREDRACKSDDETSCPKSSPSQLTAKEKMTIKQMVTSPDYRHVPTSRLALLAQRLGSVFASPSTWYKLVREHRWRRPRKRIYPTKPKVGLRTTRPDEAWHIDVTVIKLLDGTKLYLHGVIDSFSKRILSWRLSTKLRATSCAAVLIDALRDSVSEDCVPTAVVDGGSENFNGDVDALVNRGLLRRLLAQTDLRFSNSPIEAFWKSLKHQWLYLNTLDSYTAVERLVAFFVEEHNALPHSSFKGQTPDEMYYDTGEKVPQELGVAKAEARRARLETNRSLSCESCPHLGAGAADESTAAA
jgi:transposase InsO family protein